MVYLEIKNWHEFQHYTKRNPPWIKLYHTILDDYEFDRLKDKDKLLLVCLYLLAGKTNNQIPHDIEWIQRKSTLESPIDLGPLFDAGFIRISNRKGGDDG